MFKAKTFLVLGLGALLASCGSADHLASSLNDQSEGKLMPPQNLLIDGGFYDRQKWDELVRADVAALAADDPGHKEVDYVYIEGIERNAAASADQLVLFGLARGVYHASLSNAGTFLELIRWRMDFVVLDAYGKPTSDKAWRLSYELGADGWTKTLKSIAGTKAFWKTLPEFAQRKLRQTSGFLAKNPGQSPVLFGSTPREDLTFLVSEVFDFVPGLSGEVFGKAMEKIIRKATKKELLEAISQDELHFGCGFDLTSTKAQEFAEQYIEAGQEIW